MRKIGFRRLGTMIDCSRNAVMKVETIKKWIDLTTDIGYNTLMLYTEDTWEVKEQPYFGYGRGRYSAAELREINDYAKRQGMEVIPCIQTLAHLNAITRWPVYQRHIDIADILLAGDEEVYRLIDNMFATISECFDSKYVNVGMDEAVLVGRGKYYDLHGDVDRTQILLEHICKVSEIGKRYGLTLCMWSDMFYRLTVGDYYDSNAPIRKDVKDMIPDNVELIYWDYYNTEFEHYDAMLESHEKLVDNVWFAGGFWSWIGFTPRNKYSIEATKAALKACKKHEVKDIFFTIWGDNGGECSKFAVLPAVFYASEAAKGNTDEVLIHKKFEDKYGVSWDDFMLLDLPDEPNGDMHIDRHNPEKYLLYNDLFRGIADSTLQGGEGELFALCAHKLRKVPKNDQWGYLFDTQTALCEVLSVKAELGLKTREVYRLGNKEKLAAIIEDYRILEKKLDILYETFCVQWYQENKGHGFDVQDIRLGGLKQRVCHCRKILEDYLAGNIEQIEELEEKLLDYEGNGEVFSKKPVLINVWQEMVTTNVV